MTSTETLVENMRLLSKEFMELNEEFARLKIQVDILQEGLMSAVTDFKSYQLMKVK